MTATVNIRILEDGPRNTVIELVGNNGASGGAGGLDLAYTVFILPSQVDFVARHRSLRASAFKIDQVDWDINAETAMQVALYWDTATPPVVGTAVPALTAIGRKTDMFKQFGGIWPPASLVSPTGGLGIATIGASAANVNSFTIIIRLAKLQSQQS